MSSIIKHWIVISQGWDGLPIAYHLQQEGCDVTVGQIQDKSELKNGDSKEDPEDAKKRLSQYDGMLKKVPAGKLIDALTKVKNKDEYFIYFDQNNLWYYSEILLKAGFTNGIFPTQKDYDFEKSREEAMKFVDANYKEVKIIPFEQFAKTDEAIAFLEENEGVYVIQSKGDYVSTYVPQSDDPEMARKQSISNLNKNKANYDKGGLILKTKLVNPVEITPQIVFFNGEPVFTDVDIETKNIGDGQNNGGQVGCGSNLIISTDMEEKINEIAFPKAVYDMAKEHTGIFVWDISLYMMTDGIYFGEFCPNRFGYDAVMTEMTMAGGVQKYFESVMAGKNPLKKKYGTAIRLFDLNMKADNEISFEGIEKNVWLYEVSQKNGIMVSIGGSWDLGVLTAANDNLESAVHKLYDLKEKFSLKEFYTRTMTDFLELYPTSILQRYKAINHKYIEAQDVNAAEYVKSQIDGAKANYDKSLKDSESKYKTELKSIQDEIKTILASDQ